MGLKKDKSEDCKGCDSDQSHISRYDAGNGANDPFPVAFGAGVHGVCDGRGVIGSRLYSIPLVRRDSVEARA